MTIPNPEHQADLLSQHHNDHGNAERLIALHGTNLRYYHAINRWLIWDGRRWRIDDTGQVYKLAKNAMLRFLLLLGNLWMLDDSSLRKNPERSRNLREVSFDPC